MAEETNAPAAPAAAAPAAGETAAARKKGKKGKKNILNGVVHIQSTFNNTKIASSGHRMMKLARLPSSSHV